MDQIIREYWDPLWEELDRAIEHIEGKSKISIHISHVKRMNRLAIVRDCHNLITIIEQDLSLTPEQSITNVIVLTHHQIDTLRSALHE